MRKGTWFIILAVVVLVVATIACRESTPEVAEPEVEEEEVAEEAVEEEPAEESIEEPTDEPIEEPTEEPEPTQEPTDEPPVGTTRGNPAPPGSEVTVDDMTFLVEDAVRPADDIVKEGNPFNPDPEEGNEYIVVTVSVTCEKGEDETCNIGPMVDLSVIGSAGVARDTEWFISGVDGQLESTEFYGGSTISGKLFFEVGQDETDLVLRYESLFGTSKAFLALP